VKTTPVVTANWGASNDQGWTVPIGRRFGRIFEIGKQPADAALQSL
jgi:hypothetical protein